MILFQNLFPLELFKIPGKAKKKTTELCKIPDLAVLLRSLHALKSAALVALHQSKTDGEALVFWSKLQPLPRTSCECGLFAAFGVRHICI